MKAAKIFLAIIFMMAISLGVKAQDKYEYGSLVYAAYSATKGYIYTSTDSKYEKTDVKIEEGVISVNLMPVLAVVNKMSAEGWEVYNSNTFGAPGAGVQIYYFLRKKKS